MARKIKGPIQDVFLQDGRHMVFHQGGKKRTTNWRDKGYFQTVSVTSQQLQTQQQQQQGSQPAPQLEQQQMQPSIQYAGSLRLPLLPKSKIDPRYYFTEYEV